MNKKRLVDNSAGNYYKRKKGNKRKEKIIETAGKRGKEDGEMK